MSTFQQNWARIAFPHPQPARKERLLPPLFENEGSPQTEFDERMLEPCLTPVSFIVKNCLPCHAVWKFTVDPFG